MIANARMYAVSPDVEARWDALFALAFARAGAPLELARHPAPAPLEALWQRHDLGAVFMCGLPFSQSQPQPMLLAAPVAAPADYADEPTYWSDFVVRADSAFETLQDTFGHRLALTVPGSQSGCVAALWYLLSAGYPANVGGSAPLFAEVIAPTITPLGSLGAVLRGEADVAPLDSYALLLLRRYRPDLTDRIRLVARTEATPNPLLVSTPPGVPGLQEALCGLHEDPTGARSLEALSLARFAAPHASAYGVLAERREAAFDFWRRHPLAARIDPAFGLS